MIRYLLRRLGFILLQLLVVSIILFVLTKAVPGDILSEARMNPQISPETIAALQARYGLDQPLPVRYFRWLRSVGAGDFGYSFAYNIPVSALIWPRVRHTLLLTIPALILAWLLGIPVGVLAAFRRGSWLDRMISGGTSTLLALPDLFIALVFLLLALRTGLFPVGGMNSGQSDELSWWSAASDTLWHMVLPVTALVIGSLPTIVRHVRAGLAEALESSYIRAAQGHGLSTFRILVHHALPAAANPLISLFGLSVAGLLGTSLLVEVMMSWPGLGPLVLDAILARDLFVVIGVALVSVVLLSLGNLLADISLYAFDPRIRVRT